MSEIPSDGADGAVPQIIINTQYVKDFSFENPHAPRSLMAGQAQPEVSIGVNVQIQPLAEDVYEVVLTLKADAKSAEAVAFMVELSYAGVITVTGLPQEHLRPVLLIEAPRLLFPFARAIVSEAVRDGGFPPLMINPIDFAALYRQQMLAEQEPAGVA